MSHQVDSQQEQQNATNGNQIATITAANTAYNQISLSPNIHHQQATSTTSLPSVATASTANQQTNVTSLIVSTNAAPSCSTNTTPDPHAQVKTRKETLEAKRERKAAKTLAIITGAFVVCWLPFFLMALLLPLCESCYINDKIAAFFLWLGYFNSTLNPVIYTIFSPEFRQAFKRILFGTHRGGYYRGGKL